MYVEPRFSCTSKVSPRELSPSDFSSLSPRWRNDETWNLMAPMTVMSKISPAADPKLLNVRSKLKPIFLAACLQLFFSCLFQFSCCIFPRVSTTLHWLLVHWNRCYLILMNISQSLCFNSGNGGVERCQGECTGVGPYQTSEIEHQHSNREMMHEKENYLREDDHTMHTNLRWFTKKKIMLESISHHHIQSRSNVSANEANWGNYQ